MREIVTVNGYVCPGVQLAGRPLKVSDPDPVGEFNGLPTWHPAALQAACPKMPFDAGSGPLMCPNNGDPKAINKIMSKKTRFLISDLLNTKDNVLGRRSKTIFV